MEKLELSRVAHAPAAPEPVTPPSGRGRVAGGGLKRWSGERDRSVVPLA